MKQTTRAITVQAYQDGDGKPVCGNCTANSAETWCEHQTLNEPCRPKKDCPIWGEGSKEEEK